ncbi:MAG: response regulator [Arenibacter sp.]|nr:response regulator [Arenibacter sp.]
MNMKDPKLYPEQTSLAKLETLCNHYTEVFEYQVLSVSEIIGLRLCTITLFSKQQAFVVASTENSINKIWPLNTFFKSDLKANKGHQSIAPHPVATFEVQFSESHPILGDEGDILGSLNIFDDKIRELTDFEKQFLEKTVLQIRRWMLSKEKEQHYEKHHQLFELSSDLVGIANFEGSFVHVNPAFAVTLGWTAEDLIGSPCIKFVYPEDLEATERALKDVVSGTPTQNFTNRYYTKEKNVKWIEWTCMPEMDTQQIFFIGRDVTEFVEREQQLKISERKYHNLFDNIHGILCVHDLDGNFLEVNQAGLTATGYTRDNICKSNLFNLIADEKEAKVKEYLAAVALEGQASGEMSISTASGEEVIWFFTSILDEGSDGNKQVLANVVDITELRKMDYDLKKAKQEAELAYKAKSEFVANMSHEIRTPLNGIIGFTELLLETNLNDTQKQYLEIINQSGVSLYSIINDILDFSKIEGNHMKLERDRVEVEEVASEAFNIVSYGIQKKGLEMLIDIDPNMPRYIWSDAMRLKQVLVNLLGNALKFTEEGEIKLYVRILKDFGDGKMRLRFGVKDTGIGIHPDKQQDIFNAFSQEDGSISKKYGGTGLGLTISNKLLGLANSSLQLKSKQGEGSDFYFDVDFKVAYEEFDYSLKGIDKVLIVDDNEKNRQILRRMLEIKGIEVVEAASGQEALSLIQRDSEFDVVIMDYHMPEMNGVETIKKIKGIAPTFPDRHPFIVLYSSSDNNQLQESCAELNIENRIIKPIRMKQLYQMLSNLKRFSSKEKPPSNKDAVVNNSGSLTILVAEDNEVNAYLARLYLKNLLPDAVVLEAVNGEEAVGMYQSEHPDLVFMDVQMPIMDGLRATQKIRELESNMEVPIIALTSGSMPGEKEKCLDAGMTDFLAKPLLQQTLRDMLKKWLGVTNVAKD